jgi:hypothetical protein
MRNWPEQSSGQQQTVVAQQQMLWQKEFISVLGYVQVNSKSIAP